MSQAVLREEVEALPPISTPPPSPKRRKKRRLTMRRAHKWMGITAALWLAVLGVTGFFLDHRDWRWMWQTALPDSMFPERIIQNSEKREILFHRINPENDNQRFAAGKRGFWWSDDKGATWSVSRFLDTSSQAPQVFSVVADPISFEKLWIATDDGVWLSFDGGKEFYPFALEGRRVSDLAFGSDVNELVGVLARSFVFKLNTDNALYTIINLGIIDEKELPDKIGFSRFVRDLHYGRGVVNGIGSLLINDAGGIAMVILPLTGILFWLLPRRWKKRRANSKKEHVAQRTKMRFLHRWHGLYIGILSAIVIVYLAITGIIIDHSDALMSWMKTIKIDRSYLPPVYEMHSWNDEIYSVVAYPGYPGRFSVGTRSGLFTSEDNGKSWEREKLPGPQACFIWSLTRVDEYVFAGGMGCPNSYKKDGGLWQGVRGVGHMPTDAFRLADGRFVWKSSLGLTTSPLPNSPSEKINAEEPVIVGTSIFYLIDGLHSGMYIHTQWKWINDIVSIMAILLCVSGFIRLWRQRRQVFWRVLGIRRGRKAIR